MFMHGKMKFDSERTAAAHAIARKGVGVRSVGVHSQDGNGSVWRAMVRCNRTMLLLANESDSFWRLIKSGGDDYLVWLEEVEHGYVVTHATIDMNHDDHSAMASALYAEWEATTRYRQPIEPSVFDWA